MKNSVKALLMAVAIGTTATMATAQEEGPRREGGRPPGPPPVPPIIAALDLDKNGEIDADEIAKASDSLKKLDKNNDGKINREELRPPGAPGGFGDRRGPRPPEGPRDGNPERPQRPRPPGQ